MQDQQEIIQKITDLVLETIEDGWKEIVLNYRIEGSQSEYTNTYLIDEDGVTKEKSIRTILKLDSVFRELNAHLSEGGKESFTRCRIYLSSNGKFNADYSYEKIDWDEISGWNFDLENR